MIEPERPVTPDGRVPMTHLTDEQVREAEKLVLDELGISWKRQNSALTVIVYNPFKVESLTPADKDYRAHFAMDDAWDYLLRVRADLQASRAECERLRTERSKLQDRVTQLGLQIIAQNEQMPLRQRAESSERECERLRGLLREDAAGRTVADLLETAANILNQSGGGPLADCLQLKANDIRSALSTGDAKGSE